MENLNEDSSNGFWPFMFGDKIPMNGHYYGFTQRVDNGYLRHEKDVLKQKMLQHEAVFKNQVSELHRLYRIQKDMMDEVKRKEPQKHRASMEPASSSSIRGSRLSLNDAGKWHTLCFTFLNSEVKYKDSPASYAKGSEGFDSRPLKARKKLFDLHLPAEESVDTEEGEIFQRQKPKNASASASPSATLCVDFLGRGLRNEETKRISEPTKPRADCIDIDRETARVRDGFLIPTADDKTKVDDSRWFFNVDHKGFRRSNLSSLVTPVTSPLHSHLGQCILSPIHPQHDLDSERNLRHLNNSYLDPAASWTQGSFPFCSPSGQVSSKMLSRTPQPSTSSQVSFHEKWQINAGFSLNPPLRSEFKPNGFYQASTSGPFAGDVAIECSTKYQLQNCMNGSCQEDLKPAMAIDLNEALSNSSSNEVVIPQDLKRKGEPVDPAPALPWLKHKPSSTDSGKKRKNGMIDINVACEADDQAAAEELTIKETKKSACVRDYIDLNTCASDCEDPSATYCDRTCAGVKIAFEIDLEAPAFAESDDDFDRVSKEDHQGDTPLALLETKQEQMHDKVLRNAAETIAAISLSGRQISRDDETLLEISVHWFVDAVSSNELEKVSVEGSRLKDGSSQQDSSNEMDEFEVSTLQLQEATEVDYMPHPSAPQVEKEGDMEVDTVPSRSRRVFSRRGRQRRDFQRDILPGMTTLARHEVTEDIQTFGGVMKALGHYWNPGMARRNGGTRGRRRALSETIPAETPILVCAAPSMQKFTGVEAGLEERRLTRWGKTTTRRPRRQRCPAGNLQPAAVLT
ncbi:uncharacterized protein LOC127260693 isoform X2 [Andrographis paniculata]|uniref:uncharacterized protein LOC127260693 isoform X2 n=1 Tax=Andrographis paniculata TaxID=175694 RepID=UPI0021E7742E|nr:uncharacterized protein LOC127260693 isoform X2 [Andrographis paniculata]